MSILKFSICSVRRSSLFLVLSLILSFSSTAQNVDWYFTVKNGWDMKKHVRVLADVNGDGMDDIVGFGNDGVQVAFSKGINFTKPQLVLKNFAIKAGSWSVDRHVRTAADVNGDGKADIVGFGEKGILVALSTGSGFSPATMWMNHSFSPGNGWNNTECVRTVADVNADGKADIVGFGGKGVFVALSDGQRFLDKGMWVNDFAIGAGGWQVNKHTRLVTDINGDKKADIIGFGGDVYTALSIGTDFAEKQLLKDQAYYINPNWWNLQRHRRMMADVNGDGMADIVGFTEYKVYVSLARGTGFETQRMCFEHFNYAQGWSPEKYPVLMGDINGDGKDDIIGFKKDKVYVSCSHGNCFCPPVPITFLE